MTLASKAVSPAFSLSIQYANRFSVTEAIEYLLQVISLDVSSFKQNSLAAYTLLSTAYQVYHEIGNLIEKTDLDPSDVWQSYDLYTSAIDPLEEFLLRFALLSEHESLYILPDAASESVQERIITFEEWKRRRDDFHDLRQLLNSLSALKNLGVYPVSDGFQDSAKQRDDSTILSALCRQISNPLLNITPAIEKVQNTASGIPSKIRDNIADESMVECVRLEMLLHWAMEKLRSPMDPKVQRHLTSPIIWTAAERALSKLISHLEQTAISAEDVKDVQREVTYFEDLLKNLPDGPSNALLELMKFAKRVRRPFHSQTLVLIAQCRALAQLLQEGRDEPSAMLAIQEAKYAIDIAAHAMVSIGKFSDNIPTHQASGAFRAAESKIREIFTQHDLTGRWNELKKIQAGMEEDVRRVEQMNAWLEKAANPRQGRSANALSVRIVVLSNPALNCERTVEEHTRLSMLLWERATQDASLLRGSYFAIADAKNTDRLVPVYDDELVSNMPAGRGGVRVVHIVGR